MLIANWKMNGSKELIKEWLEFVSKNIEITQTKKCIFCPPISYLDFTGTLIQQSYKDIRLGSQQCNSELSAPLTGGINSQMLEDVDCEFVIIGHSEQRTHLKESNKIAIIAKKFLLIIITHIYFLLTLLDIDVKISLLIVPYFLAIFSISLSLLIKYI